MSPSVIVIGSGVIGTSCAYYLERTGWKVTLVDRTAFGQGASHANCGLVVPSHVLPLAEPGAVRNALQGLLRGTSRFSIKLPATLGLWSWLVNFARRCNRRDMLEAGRAIQGLLESSRALYDELVATEALDCEWETRGLLHVYRTRSAMDEYAKTDRLLREEFELAATRYDAEALATFEPALKPGLAGAWYYPEDAQLRPDKLLDSWCRVLAARGVTLVPHCEVKEFVHGGGRARAVKTPNGDLTADAFVVATGAWTPRFARSLGARVPIEPGKGYSMTMARPAKCPARPLIFPSHGVVATPMQSGYRLGSTLEFAGYDASLNPARLEFLRRAASEYLLEPHGEPVEEEWYGWRPMTYDGKPIIDRSPALANVVIAAGHNMLGLSMAPATGKLVAELLGDGVLHLDRRPFSATRF